MNKIAFCHECGKEFIPKNSKHKYCSYKCRIKSTNRRFMERYHSNEEFRMKHIETVKKSQKKYFVPKEPKRYSRICKYCGKEFIAYKIHQVFCCSVCSGKYFRKICSMKASMALDEAFKERFTEEQINIFNELADRQQIGEDIILDDSCKVCGTKEGRLIVHHISYNPLEYVTLCSSCHQILHTRFLGKVRVSPQIVRQK